MQIIPAIDIKNGKCVRLFQGKYDKETVYSNNPIAIAKQWKNQGAQLIHIVDLDGAKEGKPKIIQIAKQIINEVQIPIQVGGGIRNLVSMYRYIDIGVSRIVLGTTAFEKQKLLKKAISIFGEKIIVSLDMKGKNVMKKGWLQKTDYELGKVIKYLELSGLKTIIYTDITRDGTMTEPNYKDIAFIRNKTKMKLIVSGGISSFEQIRKLKKMNVDGVIIGKALYEGKINLKEAIDYVN